MTDEFNPTPKPGALLEMPEGWDVLYATAEQQPAMTDERIIDVAVCHSNHKLKAQSGMEFEVISHPRVIAFAREIEAAERKRCLEIVWDACPQNGQGAISDFQFDICEEVAARIATGGAA